MRNISLAAALVAVGYSPAASASIVLGNPDDLTPGFAGHGLAVQSAELDDVTLVAEDCSGTTVLSVGPQDLDLTTAPTVTLPSSTCAVFLEHAGTLTVSGTGSGNSFTLELCVPDLEVEVVDPPGSVAELRWELAPPGWTTATELGLGSGSVTLGCSDSLEDTIVGRITAGHAVFEDADSDGTIDSTERAAGPVAE